MPDNRPLDLAAFDPDRVRGVIELGLAQHPDPDAVALRLRAGCEFVARRMDDGRVEFRLVLTDRAEQVAEMRAAVGGLAPLRREPGSLEPLTVIIAHASALGQPPQG